MTYVENGHFKIIYKKIWTCKWINCLKIGHYLQLDFQLSDAQLFNYQIAVIILVLSLTNNNYDNLNNLLGHYHVTLILGYYRKFRETDIIILKLFM